MLPKLKESTLRRLAVEEGNLPVSARGSGTITVRKPAAREAAIPSGAAEKPARASKG